MNLDKEIHSKKNILKEEFLVEKLSLNICYKYLLNRPKLMETYTTKDKKILLNKIKSSLRSLLKNLDKYFSNRAE